MNPEEYPQGNTSLKNVAGAMFRHRRAFTLTVLAILGVTIAVTLLTRKQYESEMNILVGNTRAGIVISPERSNGTNPPNPITDDQINSEIEVLSSKDLADNVVDPGWTSVPSSQRSDAQIRIHDVAVARFRQRLNIEPPHHSDIIHVTYTDASGRHAHEMLTRLLTAFLAKQRELEQPGDTTTFFANAADRTKAELDDAQLQLATYQQQRQMVSLPDKEMTLEKQVSDLQDQMRATEAQIGEAEGRLNASREQLQAVPSRQSTQQRTIPNGTSIEQLNVMLTTLKNQRTELLTKYPPTERLVLELDQKIATTNDALHAAALSSVQETETDVNPVWQQMNSGVAQSSTDLQALRNRRDHLAAQIAGLQGNLSSVEGGTVDFTTLQQKVTELQANYQLYAQKRDEAQMADAMDQEHLLNVAVVEEPTLSSRPTKPLVLNNLIMGGFTAVFLGLCVIFFAEMGRDTIASPQELEAISRYPVLATIPFTGDHSSAHLFAPLRLDQQPPSIPPAKAGGDMGGGQTGGNSSDDDPRVAVRARAVHRPQPLRAQQVVAQAEPIIAAATAPSEDDVQRQLKEAAHWETLRSLLIQQPAIASPTAVTRTWEKVGDDAANISPEPLISQEPLLKPAAPQESAIITRSTAAHFPLPSVVPSVQTEEQTTVPVVEQKAVTETHMEAHVEMHASMPPVIEAVAEAPIATAPPAEIAEAQPVEEKFAPSHRSETRKHAILHEKLTESWAESLSQRVLSTLGHNRPSRTGASGSRPAQNQAEVSYNPQGKVDYVTYTFNAPTRKNNGRIR